MTKEQALYWFWKGFEATGEGCNGEYTRRSFDSKEFEKDNFEQEWYWYTHDGKDKE